MPRLTYPEMNMKDQPLPNPTPIPASTSQRDVNSVHNLSSDEGLGRSAPAADQDAEANRKVIALLNELIETSMDGEKGFALAAKDSKEPSLTVLFSEGEQSCRAAAAELQDQVRMLGGNAEDGGSMKAAVHRGWISIKSAATSRDSKAILEECERGEDYAKAKYADALKQALPEPVRTLVARQYQGVIANHDRVRDLRNQYRS
jgi:uncharacterized protein (TIGR02284 family)